MPRVAMSMTKVKRARARLKKVRKWVTAASKVTVLGKTNVCASRNRQRLWQQKM